MLARELQKVSQSVSQSAIRRACMAREGKENPGHLKFEEKGRCSDKFFSLNM